MMMFKELGTLSIKYTDIEYVVEWFYYCQDVHSFMLSLEDHLYSVLVFD